MTDELFSYICAHSTPEDEYLQRLYHETCARLLYPRMASGHVQGLLLRILARTMQAKRVLEIGTYSGYATLSLAAGMDKDGIIDTFEINDEQEVFTRPWLENSPYEPTINLHIGDALQLLTPADGPYDLIYIDANKRQYLEYYHKTFPLLRQGGLLLADNTLWDGHVVSASHDNDPQTLGVKAFNDFVATDGRAETVILPLRDGLTLVRKR